MVFTFSLRATISQCGSSGGFAAKSSSTVKTLKRFRPCGLMTETCKYKLAWFIQTVFMASSLNLLRGFQVNKNVDSCKSNAILFRSISKAVALK